MKGKILLRIIPIILALFYALFQWLSSEKVTNPLTGETSRVGLSREQEEQLGLQAFRHVLAREQTVESGAELEQVRRVAARLATATGDEAKGFDWRVSVVENEQHNAFCLPGGKIVVYTGILPITQSDAGLAVVMGHEMAHATLRHGGQRVLKENIAQTVMLGTAVSIADMDYQKQRLVLGALGAGAAYGVLLPFSRDHESEADELGLIYMARAGYDPREAIPFWERMAKAGGGGSPEFLSTHPSHGTRIQRLKSAMPKALEIFQSRAALNDNDRTVQMEMPR